MSCGAYRKVKLLEHAMKSVERILKKRIRCLTIMNKMQFWFYAWKRVNRCSVYFSKNARGILSR